MIEDFRLNIEDLSPPAADFDFKKDGAKRHAAQAPALWERFSTAIYSVWHILINVA